MRSHLLTAAAALVLLGPGVASAADMAGAPPSYYVPAPTGCGEPVVLLPPAPPKNSHKPVETDYPRIFTVLPYNPGCPSGPPVPFYVPPQQAYLASSPTRLTDCLWPCRDARHHDWYDGKLWYHNAGTAVRPDVFMILQRD